MILSKFSRNSAVLSGFGRRFRLGMLLALVLGACAPVAERPSVVGSEAMQSAREAELSGDPTWAFSGRLAVSQGSNGGSGRIDWRQDGDDFQIQLSAPITRQSWLLKRVGGRVSLEGLDGGIREGSDAEALLQQATGWRIPLGAMAAWVRGVRASGAAELSYGPQGLPATLLQDGWAVEYRNWGSQSPALPQKLFARQGEASVRLVIESWQP